MEKLRNKGNLQERVRPVIVERVVVEVSNPETGKMHTTWGIVHNPEGRVAEDWNG